MFCPDFTIHPINSGNKSNPNKAEDLANIDSCEHIWEAGVGFGYSQKKDSRMELNRTELLKLLLTCFSETIYRSANLDEEPNRWIA